MKTSSKIIMSIPFIFVFVLMVFAHYSTIKAIEKVQDILSEKVGLEINKKDY